MAGEFGATIRPQQVLAIPRVTPNCLIARLSEFEMFETIAVNSCKRPKSGVYACLSHRFAHFFQLLAISPSKASPNIASHRAGAAPLRLALMASESTSTALVGALLEAKAEVTPRLQETNGGFGRENRLAQEWIIIGKHAPKLEDTNKG